LKEKFGWGAVEAHRPREKGGGAGWKTKERVAKVTAIINIRGLSRPGANNEEGGAPAESEEGPRIHEKIYTVILAETGKEKTSLLRTMRTRVGGKGGSGDEGDPGAQRLLG